MKFYVSGLADLIQKVEKNSIQAVLMHGANQGFIATAIEQLSKKLNLTISNYEIKELTPTRLEMLANSKNFFGQRELIKVHGASSALSKDMKDMLTQNNFHNLICFIGSDSLPPSGIRKFFEEQANLASLGCYYDNEQTIAKIILQQCAKRNKTIEEEALVYLKSHLKGDHQIIKSELEKLFNFTHDQETITKEDVVSTISQDLLASGDEMCIFFAKKQPMDFIKEVAKLQEQNKNEVLMIRALIRFYMNIYVVSLRLEDGDNLDRAIKTLYPPIFFKYVDDFKQIVRKYSASDALRCLQILQSSEVHYKTSPKSFDMFSIYTKFHL